MNDLYLGVEIGATKQQVAIGTKCGDIAEVIKEVIPLANGAHDILDWITAKVPEIIARNITYRECVCAIGVGFGGPLDSRSGQILMSMQVPGWNDFRLKDWFEDRFSIRTRVVNDTVAGGFAELVLGSGRECKNFFYTNIGSGIGGAMFINRKYYDGIGFGASYLGNTYVADWTASLPGVVCKLESLCSGLGIEARIRMPGYVPKSSMLTELCGGITKNLTCAMLGKAATAGDIFALDEVDRIAYAYGAGLCNLLALMSPDCITIGGGVVKLGDILLNPIRKYVEEMSFISNKGHFQILEGRLLDNAVIVGAILCAAETQQRLPRVPGRSMSTGVVSQRIANSK